MDARDRLTLTDLGSCRRFEEGAAATKCFSSHGFAAPEALWGRPFDPFANDVFSLGAVLIECLLGVHWFADHWLPVAPKKEGTRAAEAAGGGGGGDNPDRQSFRSLEELYRYAAPQRRNKARASSIGTPW